MPIAGKADSKLKVILLTNEALVLPYQKSTTVEDVYHEICDLLELNEREVFGLAVLSMEGFLFLDPSEKLKKIDFNYLNLESSVGKLWRKALPNRQPPRSTFFSPMLSNSSLLPSHSYPHVYFRVRFYIPLHCIRERDTQHLYYEQLRTNLLEYGLYCDLATYLELGALALQAEYGNAPVEAVVGTESELRLPIYFDPEGIYPRQLIQDFSKEELIRMTFARHAALQNMPRRSAEFHFIHVASKHTSNFNKHLYRLDKMDQSNFTVWLGVSPDGLELHQQLRNDWIVPTNVILWRDIHCFSKKDRTFVVRLRTRKAVRKFQFRHSLSTKHMFALASHMHFFQFKAELSAPYASGLLEHIERGFYEERYL